MWSRRRFLQSASATFGKFTAQFAESIPVVPPAVVADIPRLVEVVSELTAPDTPSGPEHRSLDIILGEFDGSVNTIHSFAQNREFYLNIGIAIPPNDDCMGGTMAQYEYSRIPDILRELHKTALAAAEKFKHLVLELKAHPEFEGYVAAMTDRVAADTLSRRVIKGEHFFAPTKSVVCPDTGGVVVSYDKVSVDDFVGTPAQLEAGIAEAKNKAAQLIEQRAQKTWVDKLGKCQLVYDSFGGVGNDTRIRLKAVDGTKQDRADLLQELKAGLGKYHPNIKANIIGNTITLTGDAETLNNLAKSYSENKGLQVVGLF